MPAKTPLLKSALIVSLLTIFSSCHKDAIQSPTNSITSNKNLTSINATATVSYDVDPASGNDNNTGKSLTAAWKTIQKSFNAATAGSTVFIKGGTYHEQLSVNVSGTAAAPITFKNYNSTPVYIDGSTIAGTTIFTLTDRSNLVFKNLVVRNITKNNAQGILVVATKNGGVSNVTFSHVSVQHINWSASATAVPNDNDNAQGLIVYGQGSTEQNAVSNLVIDSCEVSNNILGFSEGVSLDGNIDGFTITNNKVHDNTNIGIDAIGHYGTSPLLWREDILVPKKMIERDQVSRRANPTQKILISPALRTEVDTGQVAKACAGMIRIFIGTSLLARPPVSINRGNAQMIKFSVTNKIPLLSFRPIGRNLRRFTIAPDIAQWLLHGVEDLRYRLL